MPQFSCRRPNRFLLRILLTLLPFLGFARTVNADPQAGVDWQLVTNPAAWGTRMGPSMLVYQEKMWLLGGLPAPSGTINGANSRNDVWSSLDGVNWEAVTTNAGWRGRYDAAEAVFDGRMWILGGVTPVDVMTNDVWSSADGANWRRDTSSAPWARRMQAGAFVLDGKLWILGGYNNFFNGDTLFSDVWCTTDGSNWTVAVTNAPWGGRSGMAVVQHDGKVWLMGGRGASGQMNDVWSSSDGVDWVQVTAAAPWLSRWGHTCLSYDGTLWLMSGLRVPVQRLNDVWSSSDGEHWHQATTAPWNGRDSVGALVYDNFMWVMGGQVGTLLSQNDIWRTTATPQFTLTVVSDHGGAYPGTVTTNTGTFLTQWVTNSPVSGGAGTQYVCVAGAVVSNAFTSVTSTNVTLTLTNNATLTWQWRTNFWLDTAAGAGGTVDPGDGWYSNGAAVAVQATASNGWNLLTWIGDVPAGMETSNPLALTMDRARTLAAVFATNIGGRVDAIIGATSDDAEQWYDGTMQLVSADLELIHNPKPEKLDQIAGLRFPNLAIPAGSLIRSAYIQFTARQDESDPCSLTVRVERVDSALTFTAAANNLSSRAVTTSAVPWSVAGWVGDESGTPQRTPDLTVPVQEVINRAGWQSGNALSFIVTGNGTRSAMSYDGDAARAPVLHLVWGWSTETLPEVENALPDGVSPTSETLVGDLLSDGGATTAVRLYWGRTDGGTNKLAWTNSVALGAVGEGKFQTTVSGLTPNTVYYYRAYALNSVGEDWADSSGQFATLSGGDVTNGMVLHWKLDEGGGTQAADSSGHGNTGTVVNAAAGNWVAGRFGSALSITAGTPYVFNTNLSTTLTGDLTLSCWIFSRSTAGLALDLVSATGMEWQMREDGDLGRLGWEGAGGPATALYTTWSVHLDLKWHHVAFVREGTTYRLYVDNRYVGTSIGSVVSYRALWAGRSTGGGMGWQGEIDDVRLYNRALSWGEVGSLQSGEGLGPLAATAPVIVRTAVPVAGQFTIMWASEPLIEYSVHRAPNLFSLPGITLSNGIPADPTGTNFYTDSSATNASAFYIIRAIAP
ncbi:MAG: hypothetical protein O3B24_00300 [Verrucomicrobia bacterium]|nr:hypothetical protein [Verrucomicrobiota bacterium]